MKNLIILFFMLFSLAIKAQVQFDSTDAQNLRAIVFYANPKGISDADATLFSKIDKQLSKSGNLNLGLVPNIYLAIYADRLYYDYENYKRSEANAQRFLKLMKKIKETDPSFSSFQENSQVIYEIENIKKDIK